MGGLMTNRSVGLLTAGLLCLAVAPASALAADVTVRVEGPDRTLVSQRTVSTPDAPVIKDADPAHGCPGSSAAGALEAATAGQWTANYSDGLGYYVTAIRGVAPTGNRYFTFWLNGASSQVGLCQAELRDGDDVLLYVDDATKPVLPLVLRAPAKARAGRTVTVRVTALSPAGRAGAARGAVVRRNGVRVGRTNRKGVLRVRVPRRGSRAIFSADGAGYARSAPVPTKVARS
jgi:hypothetical protein